MLQRFIGSAKGAARTPESIQEPIAPRSVLREFLSRLLTTAQSYATITP
jgi:hypothetical protein